MNTGWSNRSWPKVRLRPWLVLWHRWFGILGAVWLILLGLTGSAIVYYDELDAWLNADLRRVEAGQIVLPVQTLVEAAQSAYPDRFVRFVDMPSQPQSSVLVSMPLRPDAPAGVEEVDVFVNPYTAEVLGERTHEDGLGRRHIMNFLYGLHMDLHLGPYMVWFLGLVSLLWVIDHLIALILSFPTPRKWLASFRVRWQAGGHKRTFDLHRAGGVWFLPLTLMLAVSGVYFNWYDEFTGVVNRLSPVTPRAIFTVPALETPNYTPETDFGEAVARAISDKLPAASVDMMSYNPYKGIYELRLYDPRDIDSYGRRLIVIDAQDARLISDRHVAEGTAGDVFVAWQYPLHSGKAFGGIGRAIIFASGLILTGLCVTGLMIWWRKRRAVQKRH
ncbi:MAG: PepSY-associated TM helix domain-containing protein [Asticcacaulis sp.]